MSDFRSLVAEKELEWKSALNQQIALLEASLASRESELREERKMSAQLKEDFKYNIRLVKERDDELAAMERESILLKQQAAALEDKLTAASLRLDECRQQLAEEAQARSRLAEQVKSLEDSRERELQLLRHERDLEASRMRDEQQALRRQLEMDSARWRKELEVQKRELTGAFDARAEELQAEYERRAGQMEKVMLDWEVKCDLLEKDGASLRQSRAALLQRLETGEAEAAGLEKRLTESSARYQSDIAVLENEKERLQELLASLEVNHRAAVERLEQKLASAQADAGRRDEADAATAARQREDRQAVRKQTAELLGKLHEAEASFQRKAAEFEAAARGKDQAIAKLTDQVEELQAKLHASKADVGRLFVDKDAEVERLRRLADATAEELKNRQSDLERYKRELETAMERERQFEERRHQLEVDYQRRVGELETLQYEKSETYIERLTQARNEALVQLDELKSTLAQKQVFIQSLLKDREAALAALKDHGVSLDRRMESKTAEADLLAESERRARELAQQNEALKEIVRQMRIDMEALGAGGASAAAELQPGQQPKPKSPASKPPAAQTPSPLSDIRSIQELSNVLAKLRAEKTDLLAQCRRQQARIGHLEKRSEEFASEKTALETSVEQLQYQVSAQERHHATELAALRRRVQELELQLDESQREADEYYKANIEQGRLCEQLQHEALELKARTRAAGGGGGKPGEVNFGAQELYIQQLQNEIEELRARMRARQLYGEEEDQDAAGDGRSSEQVSRLRVNLKMAANQIRKLAQENQALVDLSNRLRADLNKLGSGGGVGGRRPQQAPTPAGQVIELESHAARAVKEAVGGMSEKLRELERMQYYLTREELARRNAARGDPQSQPPPQDHLGDSQPVKDPGASAGTGAAAVTAAGASAAGYRRAAGLRATTTDSLNLSSVGGGGESLREVWQLLDDEPPTARNQALQSLRTRRGAGGDGI